LHGTYGVSNPAQISAILQYGDDGFRQDNRPDAIWSSAADQHCRCCRLAVP